MAAFYGGGSKTPALSYIGLGGYALGAPAVHLARGRTDVALADLGVRVAAPIVFAAIGYGIDMSSSSPCDGGDFCFRGVGGLLVGAWLGHVTAVVLDAAVFAVEPARRAPETPDEARAEPPRPRLVPSLAIGPQGASAGVGGTF